MKKLFVILFALIAANLSVSAQQQVAASPAKDSLHHHHHSAAEKQQHKQMKKDLNLSKDQKQQLKANKVEYKNKMRTLQQDKNMTPEELASQKATLHKEQKAKNDIILTPDQKQKLAAAKAQHKAQGKHAAKSTATQPAKN